MVLGYKGQSQKNYLLEDPQGFAGEFKHNIRSQTYLNAGDESVQVSNITVSGNGDKTVTVDDVTVTVAYDTDNATTASAIATAINEAPAITNVLVDVSSNVVTLKGLFTGETFTVTVTGSNISTTTTETASTTNSIEYGLLVAVASDRNFKLPTELGTPKVVEIDLTGVTAGSADIQIEGVNISTAFDTDIETTGASLVVDIERLASLYVYATYTSNVVTITGREPSNFYFFNDNSFDGDASVTIVSEAVPRDRIAGLLGNTTIREDIDNENANFTIERGRTADVLEIGDGIAIAETDFAPEDSVFVRYSGTGKQGAVSNKGGTGLVRLERARAKSAKFSNLGRDLVRVQLS